MSDPWLVDGAFEGSWYHPIGASHPSQEVIDSVDALYISHLHPDHFCPLSLQRFRKDLPIIVLDHGPNFLHRRLEELGFTNLIKLKNEESTSGLPLLVTIYAPFCKHPFEDSKLGNFLDSAIVLYDGTDTVLNANDNTPTVEAAQDLREAHGDFTVAQLKLACAGPYPSCFLNLSPQEKLAEKERLLARQKEAMEKVAQTLGPNCKLEAFAGSYCLAGSLAWKNPYLAVDGLDLGKIPKGLPYAYECDAAWPDEMELRKLCDQARLRLWEKQKQFNFFPNYRLQIQVRKDPKYIFSWWHTDFRSLNNYEFGESEGGIACHLDIRLLKRILTRQSHWNIAEVGCHIDFYREGPYNPDVHTMMSFFHV
jgi:hypothetical protein